MAYLKGILNPGTQNWVFLRPDNVYQILNNTWNVVDGLGMVTFAILLRHIHFHVGVQSYSNPTPTSISKTSKWKQHQQNKTTKKALAVGFQVSKRESFHQEGLVGFLWITSAHHTH